MAIHEMTAEDARLRADSYTLLSTLFWAELTREVIEGLRDGPIAQTWRDSSSRPAEALPEDTGNRMMEVLACEYARLFLGPGPHVPPYESVHRADLEGGGSLWGEATQRVNRYVQHFGLSIEDGAGRIPDHIAVELEFLGRVCAAEAVARNVGDKVGARGLEELHSRFFEEHLGVWGPGFCRKALKRLPHPFYEALLHVTLRFLEAEALGLQRDGQVGQQQSGQGIGR